VVDSSSSSSNTGHPLSFPPTLPVPVIYIRVNDFFWKLFRSKSKKFFLMNGLGYCFRPNLKRIITMRSTTLPLPRYHGTMLYVYVSKLHDRF